MIYGKLFALFLHSEAKLVYRLSNKRRPLLQSNYALHQESGPTTVNETSSS